FHFPHFYSLLSLLPPPCPVPSLPTPHLRASNPSPFPPLFQPLPLLQSSIAVLYVSDYGYSDRLSQCVARGITKAGAGVEMMDLKAADTQELVECIGRNAAVVLMMPPTTGPAAAAVAPLVAGIKTKQGVRSFPKAGAGVEMMDLKAADTQELVECIGRNAAVVLMMPPTTGPAAAAVAPLVAGIKTKQCVRSFPKAGAGVEMMDLKAADTEELVECIGRNTAVVLMMPPTTGPAVAAVAPLVAGTKTKQ
ncbi:unnamed protein product, partial [Closterium sp. NIES-53]